MNRGTLLELKKYRVYSLANDNKVLICEVGTPSVTLSNLTPNTTYSMKIEAVDYQGFETSNGPIKTFTTPELVDNEPPNWLDNAAVIIENYNESSVTFSWTYALDESGVNKYHIFINGNLIDSVSSNVYSYTYSNLLPDATYTIKVEAEDVFGHVSQNGPSVIFKTKPDTTPPTWQNPILTYSDIKKTTLKLSWSGAFDNVGVVTYLVYKDDTKILETSETSCIVDNLTLGMQYTFKVEAKDFAGNQSTDGPSITVSFLDTDPPYWPSTTKLLTSDLTPTSVKLKWTPAEDNVDVVSYSVYINQNLYTGKIYKGFHSVLGDVYICDINNLISGNIYNIEIKASDSSGNVSLNSITTTFKVQKI